jgi:hypothetical protein
LTEVSRFHIVTQPDAGNDASSVHTRGQLQEIAVIELEGESGGLAGGNGKVV